MDNSTMYDNSTDSTDTSSSPNPYDPLAYKPIWHQNMELIVICVANGLSTIIIAARTFIKWHRLKKLRADDWWMIVAGVLLIFPLWIGQVGSNRNGGGLHSRNVPLDQRITFWKWENAWSGYYFITSFIKISVCTCLLQIVPSHFKMVRRFVLVLCFCIFSLGFICGVIWMIQCTPFMSNFDYNIDYVKCINIDNVRYAWAAFSIVFDLIICAIPFQILSKTQLRPHEKRILLSMFVATLLGTITCTIGIYGIWINRQDNPDNDVAYHETVFIICNDIEILAYAIGGLLPTLSPYLISRYRGSTKVGTVPDSTNNSNTANTGGRPTWLRKAIASPLEKFNFGGSSTHVKIETTKDTSDEEYRNLTDDAKNHIFVSNEVRVQSQSAIPLTPRRRSSGSTAV